MSGNSGVCVCAEVTEVYDTMSCLPIVSDKATTKGSKYFELGQQAYMFFNSKYFTDRLLSACDAGRKKIGYVLNK